MELLSPVVARTPASSSRRSCPACGTAARLAGYHRLSSASRRIETRSQRHEQFIYVRIGDGQVQSCWPGGGAPPESPAVGGSAPTAPRRVGVGGQLEDSCQRRCSNIGFESGGGWRRCCVSGGVAQVGGATVSASGPAYAQNRYEPSCGLVVEDRPIDGFVQRDWSIMDGAAAKDGSSPVARSRMAAVEGAGRSAGQFLSSGRCSAAFSPKGPSLFCTLRMPQCHEPDREWDSCTAVLTPL